MRLYFRNSLRDGHSATIPMAITLIWEDFAQSQVLLGDYADRTRQVFQETADLGEGFYFQMY